mmetsp:Transcript_126631/g.352822  ORF Transcript_126631/g.352822 Transcript_126631/m.352822 type:complete len:110 (+) Transcript_126631:1041-1370(+)
MSSFVKEAVDRKSIATGRSGRSRMGSGRLPEERRPLQSDVPWDPESDNSNVAAPCDREDCDCEDSDREDSLSPSITLDAPAGMAQVAAHHNLSHTREAGGVWSALSNSP